MPYIPILLKYAFQSHIEPRLPNKYISKLTHKRLIKVIGDAYKNVPFYKEYYDYHNVNVDDIKEIKDIKKLPFLTKEHVRVGFPSKLIRIGTNLEKCYISGTTGSTGKSVNFAYSMDTFMFYLTTTFRVATMIGYKPWYKAAYIKYTPISFFKIPGLPIFRSYHIPSIAKLEKQMELLRLTKPDFIAGYASIILDMAYHLTEDDKKIIKPKIICLNSELSTSDERAFISDAFRCPVYDEYSTEETWMVASQCKKGSYHMFLDNVFVEFINDKGEDVKPGEPGEMILTTLRSPIMPFIRYKIGDIGIYANKRCTCGRNFTVLKSFEGRADDAFTLPTGKKVSSLKLLNTFTKFIKSDPDLMNEFKFVQEGYDRAIIYLVPGSKYDKSRFDCLIDQLNNILENTIKIFVKLVDEIDNEGRIKRKAIESKINKRL